MERLNVSVLLNIICCLDPVPITLTSEGSIMLTNIKKISVSSEFLGLAQDITQCQTGELRADCITGKYQERVLELCKCSPISLKHRYPQNVFLISQIFESYPGLCLGHSLSHSSLTQSQCWLPNERENILVSSVCESVGIKYSSQIISSQCFLSMSF